MPILKLVMVSSLAILASIGNAAAEDAVSDSSFTFDTSFVYMSRSNPDSLNLLFNGGTPTFNSNAYGFDFVPGVDVNFGYQVTPSWNLEARGLFLGTWEAAVGPTPPGNSLATNPITPLGAASFTSTYTSNFKSFEANAGYQLGKNLRLLGGARYIELDEYLIMPFDTSVFTLESETTNKLAGVQIGAEGNWQFGNVTLDGIAKVGIFNNRLTNYAASKQPPTVPFGSYNGSFDQTAYMFEGSITGSYQLTAGLTAYAGYSLMFLENVALAPDQFPVSGNLGVSGANSFSTPGLNDILYHGLKLGIKLRF